MSISKGGSISGIRRRIRATLSSRARGTPPNSELPILRKDACGQDASAIRRTLSETVRRAARPCAD